MAAKDIGIGIAIGLFVGGAIALLYAPRSGKETRAMLRAKAGNIAGSVREKASSLRQRVSETSGDGGEVA